MDLIRVQDDFVIEELDDMEENESEDEGYPARARRYLDDKSPTNSESKQESERFTEDAGADTEVVMDTLQVPS